MKSIKRIFSSSFVYLKEVILFIVISDIVFFVIGYKNFNLPLISLANIIMLLLFCYLIGKKRNKEINEIRDLIAILSENSLDENLDINLGENLRPLETDIREMYEKQKAAISYLKKLELMRTQFIANVSHELRTPIFAIQGFLETLLNGALDDPKVNKLFLQKANLHTISLNNLLNDLIDISMIESGEMKMSFRYFNLNDFLKQIIDENYYLIDGKNITLELSIPVERISAFGDKNKLRQVINNLIQNSAKYTIEGSIQIIVETEPGSVIIKIKDSGIGINKEDLPRIFERFYRVDKARSKSVGGTGLGLAICKHIIEAHNSSISVSSEYGIGSEFSFKLKR